MPTPDDELRELFRGGRADDRAHAPSFDDTMAAARGLRRSRRVAMLGLAAAAVVALVAGWLVTRPAPELESPPQLAETSPQPDLPDAPLSPIDEAELEGLAAWEPSLATPTDFLLEDDGVLGGGLPSSDLDDPVLDLDELTMEL